MCNVSPSVQCSQWALRWWIIRTPAHALFIVNERREKLQKKLEGYFCHRLFWATTRHDSLSVTYEVSFTFQLRAIAFTCNTNRLRCRYIVILKLGSARIQVDAVGGSQWKATSGVTFPSGVYALTGSRVWFLTIRARNVHGGFSKKIQDHSKFWDSVFEIFEWSKKRKKIAPNHSEWSNSFF